jgi:hypothetical protein
VIRIATRRLGATGFTRKSSASLLPERGLDVIAVDTQHLHRFVTSIQENGNTTTRVLFAEEKSQPSLVERMQRLNESTLTDLVRN